MKLLVTGATGFTGSFVLPRFIEQGFAVRCLVRPTSNRSFLPDTAIECFVGDIGDRKSLTNALQGVDALVHTVPLGSGGHMPNIVGATVDAGIERAVFVSSTALFTTLNVPSKAVRLRAEEVIMQSGLAYTILRPTMIYGNARDRNMCRLARYLKRWPIIPIFGNGKYLQQPVYVDDVAKAIVQSFLTDVTIEKAYNIPGAAALSYNTVINTICELLNRHILKLHIPPSPVVAGLKIMEKLPVRLPIKAEQVQRLNENKVFDFVEANQDFGYQPRSFREGISLELREMGLDA